MSWVTVIWAMLIGGCIILALPHLLIGIWQRRGAHLFFVLATAGVIGIAIGELYMMRSVDLANYLQARRWTYIPIFVLVVALVGFVRLYFHTGRLWIGLSACALRLVTLIVTFVSRSGTNFPIIAGLRRLPFLGETVSAPLGHVSFWTLWNELSSLLLLIYVVDASISLWRQGSENRHRAIVVGGSIALFVLLAAGLTALIHREIVLLPYVVSFPFAAILVAMSFELGSDLFRAGQVALKLQASEASLLESEERFLTMANAAPVMVWMSTPDKLCSFFNKAWLEFTGRTMEQERNNGWSEGVHPDDLDECLQTYVKAFDARESFAMQYRLRRQDGTYRSITDRGVPRFGRSGDFRGYIGACVDVTDLLEQQRAAHESEERVTLAAEAAHLGVWEFNTETGELWMSDKAREMFQLPADKPIQFADFGKRIHPEDRIMRAAAIQQAIKTHGGYEIEYRALLQDGSIRWIHGRGRCVPDHKGVHNRLVAVSMDVTERKEAQELFSLASEASRLGVWDWDETTGKISSDVATRELFDVPREGEVTLETFFHAIFPPDLERVKQVWRHAVESGERYELEYRVQRSNGAIRWIHARGHGFYDDKGKPLRMIGIVFDITDRKQLEEDSRQRREEVVRLSRINLLGEMTASIAHELNQPLAGITSNAHAAERFIDRGDVDLGEVREILGDIASDARRASDVIQRIRNTIKKGAALRERVDINDVVTKVAHMVQPDARLHSCELVTLLEKSLPPIEGDPVEIQQVLINLTTNAFDAMRSIPAAERKVEISTSSDNGTVGLSVRDHGPGISADAKERLFEQFFTTKEDGLGMGLAIVRSIIESHGGNIAADNVDGGGARFYLKLPVSKGT